MARLEGDVDGTGVVHPVLGCVVEVGASSLLVLESCQFAASTSSFHASVGAEFMDVSSVVSGMLGGSAWLGTSGGRTAVALFGSSSVRHVCSHR